MSDQNITKFIPNGLWVPVPPNTIKFLTKHHRPADRVLYALCLHLGQGLKPVFPSYPTIARLANVGEKSLRAQYDKLIKLGFISIERKRVGKRFKNYYTILPKAWTFRDGPSKGKSGPSLDRAKRWMCRDCEKIVPVESTEFVRSVDGYGNNDDHWIHTECEHKNWSRRIQPIVWNLMNEEELSVVWRENDAFNRRGNIS